MSGYYPNEGDLLTRAEIASRFGGSPQPALPTVNNVVVAGCFQRKINPLAPERIFIARGDRREPAAEHFLAQNEPVPVFIHGDDGPGNWRYCGLFQAVELNDDLGQVGMIVEPFNIDFEDDFVGVLTLEKVS